MASVQSANGGYLDFTAGFDGDVIGSISVADAAKRVVSFCGSPGFIAYDLAGFQARERGCLTHVGPWSLLIADALNGHVTVKNVAQFCGSLDRFVELLGAVPRKELADMNGSDIGRVVDLCCFGFSGAWAPKITKLGGAFRPEAIPILDSKIACAFGYRASAFTHGVEERRTAITAVVEALCRRIKEHRVLLTALRQRIEETVPISCILTELRLVDIVLWTSQDDKVERITKGSTKPKDWWLNRTPSEAPAVKTARWRKLKQ